MYENRRLGASKLIGAGRTDEFCEEGRSND